MKGFGFQCHVTELISLNWFRFSRILSGSHSNLVRGSVGFVPGFIEWTNYLQAQCRTQSNEGRQETGVYEFTNF